MINAIKNSVAVWAIFFILLGGGCLDVNNDSQYISASSENNAYDNIGIPIQCVAPIRENYITALGGDPETKLGSIESLQHTILFLFDKSGSMDAYWDEVSKWHAAADAMIFSVAKYTAYVSAGTIFFPTDGNCGVAPITDDSQIYFTGANDFLGQWEETMDQNFANGSTPMSEAFRQADEAIAMACEDGIMERPLKVVLVADGQPTCDDELEIMTAYAQKWRAHGVMTFVIGLPGSEDASDLLEQIANAGGSTQEIIEKREQTIVIDNSSDTDTPSYDTDKSVDTSGIINPDDESELEDNISMVAE